MPTAIADPDNNTLLIDGQTILLHPQQLAERPLPDPASLNGEVIYQRYLTADGRQVHILGFKRSGLVHHQLEPADLAFCDWCQRPADQCKEPSCDDTGTHIRPFDPVTGHWKAPEHDEQPA